MPWWIKILLAAALLALLLNPLIFHKPSKGGEEAFLKELFPNATSFSSKRGDPLHYTAFKGSSSVGYCFVTTDIVPEERGYAGAIKALACMDRKGVITGVKVLEHKETPAYAHKIEEPIFLDQFRGKNVRDPFVIGKDLDGIARASVSCDAVAGSIRKSARIVSRAYLGISVEEKKGISGEGLLKPAAVLLVFSIAFLGLYWRKARNLRQIVRWVSLFASLVGLGFLLHSYISINTIVNLILLHVPPLSTLSWYLLVGGTIITTLLYGRLYCGWVCPFGAGLEIIEEFGKAAMPKPATKIPKSRAVLVKFIVLWLGVTGFAFTDNLKILGFEPFSSLFMLSPLNRAALALLLLALGGSLLVPRFWCRFLCPVGAGLSLLSAWSPWRLRSNNLCDACGDCIEVCPTKACSLSSAKKIVIFDPKECIQCNACSRACPCNAIVPGPS